DRLRQVAWLRAAAKLPFPLCLGQHHRILETLAHHPFHLDARLPLHLTGRQPPRQWPHLFQSADDDDAVRPLARRTVELRVVGLLQRRAARRAPRVRPRLDGTVMGRPAAGEFALSTAGDSFHFLAGGDWSGDGAVAELGRLLAGRAISVW